jgi:hypothetical protein
MLKQMVFFTTVASFAAAGAASAQEPRDFSQVPVQTVQLPGTAFEIVFNSPELQVGERRPMQPLSAAIMSWLAANFEIPAIANLPRVTFASIMDIADLHFSFVPSASKARHVEAAPALPARYMMLSLYSDASQTIYLPEGWNGNTPAELSMLVKEMVHHVQNAAGLEYECPQAREQLANAAQEKWLGLFERNLRQDFEMSPEVLALGTQCTPLP